MKATGLTQGFICSEDNEPRGSAAGTQTNMFLCFQVKDVETKGNIWMVKGHMKKRQTQC